MPDLSYTLPGIAARVTVSPMRHRVDPWTALPLHGALCTVAGIPHTAGGKAADAAQAAPVAPHQMIFSAQVLVRGVAMVHELCFLQPADELTASCFGAALEQWCCSPTIGGRSALGHGLVDPLYDRPFPSSRPYLDYLHSHRDEIRRYLQKEHGAALNEPVQDPRDRAQEARGGGSEDGNEAE